MPSESQVGAGQLEAHLVVKRIQPSLQNGAKFLDLSADRVPDVAEYDELLRNKGDVRLETIIARLELRQLALLAVDFFELSLLLSELYLSLCGKASAPV